VLKAGVGREKRKFEVLKNKGFGDGEAPATELVGENVNVLAKTLVIKKVTLKSAVEEMVGELEDNNQFESWGRINYEIEVKTNMGEKRREEFMKVGENGNVFGLDDDGKAEQLDMAESFGLAVRRKHDCGWFPLHHLL
jgi:hypothetical protein